MFALLRKYQRPLFVGVTVVIVASFAFFGTAGALKGSENVTRTPLFKSVTGKTITKEQMDTMVQFLSYSNLDFSDDRISSPNPLNDGIIEKDFLQTFLGGLVVEQFSSRMQADMEQILQKVHGFRPYRHPGAPFLSAESVWAQFAPEGSRLARQLQYSFKVSADTFPLLSKACLAHKNFSSVFAKRLMLYQEKQDSKIAPDPGIVHADMSLLGLHSLQDWLGKSFVSIAAEVIFNASALAEEQGRTFSLDQVRQDLMHNLQETATKLGQEIASQDLYPTLLMHIRKLGMDERQCLGLWKEVMLFRSFVSDVPSLVLDPLSLQEFYDFAKKRAVIEKYTLPEPLHCRDWTSVLELQMYLDAVASPKAYRHILSFPTEFAPIADLEKKHSDLVRKDYVLEYAMVDLHELASQVPLKQMWSWQVSDEGWNSLAREFPLFAKQALVGKEDRFAYLDNLEATVRDEVDRFSRRRIVASDQAGIQNRLDSATFEKESCLLGSKGQGLSLVGITDPHKLMLVLEDSKLESEGQIYTDDGRHYYKIRVLYRGEGKRVLTFVEALHAGVLRKMLDKKLEAVYPEVRKKDTTTYLQKDGSWVPLEKVREAVGMYAFSGLCKAIREEYENVYGVCVSSQESTSPAFYVQNRMLAPLKEALDRVKSGYLEGKDPFSQQWQVVREEVTEPRSNREVFGRDELFSLAEGEFSPVVMGSSGKGHFFRILRHIGAEKVSLQEAQDVMAPLQEEARREKMRGLLELVKQKMAVSPIDR